MNDDAIDAASLACRHMLTSFATQRTQRFADFALESLIICSRMCSNEHCHCNGLQLMRLRFRARLGVCAFLSYLRALVARVHFRVVFPRAVYMHL